jgi:hypothetical protein
VEKFTKKIVIVRGESGDWEGVYLDGQLAREDHSIEIDDLLKLLGIKCEVKYATDKTFEDNNNRLPDDLSEVEFAGT